MAVLSGNEGEAFSDQDARSGYRMPEEAHPHARTFMQWPANPVTYPEPATLAEVRQTVASIANTITAFEPVVMLMNDHLAPSARRLLSVKVEIWNIATGDLWCRDCGPVFVMNEAGELAVSHLNFNGWGSRYEHKKKVFHCMRVKWKNLCYRRCRRVLRTNNNECRRI